MKKVIFALFIACTFVSCFNDPDDVFIAQCTTPTNIQFTNITHESATIIWDDANTAASFSLEFGVSGFTLGTGTTLATTNETNTITGLDANTTYDVYVQSFCTDSESLQTEVASFTTAAPLVSTQFETNLSDFNLYAGNLADLTPSTYAFEYELATPLFTDYAYKQRIIALPSGETMEYVDNGLPNFPDNTVIAKTFYYFNNERDETAGKRILETRILIKQNGVWQAGNYKWNAAQTEAILDNDGSIVAYSYIDVNGDTQNLNYVIPSSADCIQCHSNNNNLRPIGPKLRSLNFNNQLQDFIANNQLTNLTDPTSVTVLPDWTNRDDYTLAERTRAYFDVNCAHCHQPGGSCESESSLDFRYETAFDDTEIYTYRFTIIARTQNYINTYSMPLIGTTMVHAEGYALIEEYVDSL